MNWRDLFYFSKGERRALALLTGLMAAAWMILLFSEPPAYTPAPDDGFSGKSSSTSGTVKKQPGPTYPLPNSAPISTRSGGLPAGRSQAGRQSSARKASAPVLSSSRSASDAFTPSDGAIYSSRTTPSADPAPRKVEPSHAPYAQTEKFPPGTVVELNAADTVVLKKVPGIGSTFARRIVKYRHLLGGFYAVDQLSEVYGIDEERYHRLRPWFRVDTAAVRPMRINRLRVDTPIRHPYLSYPQIRALKQQLRQKGRLAGWHNLLLLEEFTEYDRERLTPYFSFE